jgi:hypothetical protein
MEHRWNETDREKPKYSGEKNLSQCHFVHHKSHMDLYVCCCVSVCVCVCSLCLFVCVCLCLFACVSVCVSASSLEPAARFSLLCIPKLFHWRAPKHRISNYVFLFARTTRPALGPTQPYVKWITRVIYPGVKRSLREADHSPPSCFEVKMRAHGYLYPSIYSHQYQHSRRVDLWGGRDSSAICCNV